MADPYISMADRRRPVGRESSRLFRTIKQATEAGVPASALTDIGRRAVNLRATEPAVSRPEFRALEREGTQIAALAQRASIDPDIDFERDVAPLRAQYFSDVSSQYNNLSGREQEMLRSRFTSPLISEPSRAMAEAQKKERAEVDFAQSLLNLRHAADKTRTARLAEGKLPALSRSLGDIISSPQSPVDKLTSITKLGLQNPNIAGDPRVVSMINSAVASVTGRQQAERYRDNQTFQIALQAAQAGLTQDINMLFPDTSDPKGSALRALAKGVAEGQITDNDAKLEADRLRREHDYGTYALRQLDIIRKNVSVLEEDYFGIDPTQSTPEASTAMKKATINRAIDELRDLIGEEEVERLGFSETKVANTAEGQLDKLFSSIISTTRAMLRRKRVTAEDQGYAGGEQSRQASKTVNRMLGKRGEESTSTLKSSNRGESFLESASKTALQTAAGDHFGIFTRPIFN
tara:strand:- start:19942 stop:21330 length:1389 start_codon:yes stop_codon:yes gene_type:complete